MTAPYYQDDSVTLYCADWREAIPADLRADLIVTDPPYGETSLTWDRWPDGWPTLASRHANAMWCFGSMRMFLDRRDDFAAWKLSHDVIWEKNVSMFNPGDRFSRCHEFALHWYQGEWREIHHDPPRAPARKRVAGDVITSSAQGGRGEVYGSRGANRMVSDGLAYRRTVIQADSVRGVGGITPTQKPVGILEHLITYGCPVGGTVLDLFAGSCSTGVAAKRTGRKAVLYEMREEQCEQAARRLAQDVLDFGEPA